MPGVYITDFRTAASVAASQPGEHKLEDVDVTDEKASVGGGAAGMSDVAPPAASASSSSTASSRGAHPSALPGGDIPTDVEELELQLAALETNMVQLLRSNEVLEEELRSTPDDQDFLDAVRENKAIILQRSERIQGIKKQLQILAPHRVERRSEAAEQAQAQAQQLQQQQQQQQPPPGEDEQGGLFL